MQIVQIPLAIIEAIQDGADFIISKRLNGEFCAVLMMKDGELSTIHTGEADSPEGAVIALDSLLEMQK